MNLIKWKLLNPQKQKKNKTKTPTKCKTAICNTHMFLLEKNNTPFYMPVDLKALGRVN